MKVKLIDKKEEPKFKPFTIELTIESETELRNLWGRLNAAAGIFNKGSFPGFVHGRANGNRTLWKTIDTEMHSRELFND